MENVRIILGNFLKNFRKMCAKSLEKFWKILKGIFWKIIGKFLENYRKILGKILENVWKILGTFLDNFIKIFGKCLKSFRNSGMTT